MQHIIVNIIFIFQFGLIPSNNFIPSISKPEPIDNLNQLNCDSILSNSLNCELSDRIISSAISYIGYPYKDKLLDIGFEGKELVNLCEFDCVTFIENSIALGISQHCYNGNYTPYHEVLKILRYRNGDLKNYCSRLHYFSEWITDNESKGILTNVTSCLGGLPFFKRLTFISSNKSKYRQLNDSLLFDQMKKIESDISQRKLYYIPSKSYFKIESKIENGDIIAFCSKLKNLDIFHVGFAIIKKNKPYLLHASKKSGKVEITTDSLFDYLLRNHQYDGIMISRVHY